MKRAGMEQIHTPPPPVGPVEEDGVLGRGNTGTIYHVRAKVALGGLKPGDEAALKMLHPYLMEQEEARKAFLREARAGMQVRHPNLVRVFAVEEVIRGDERRRYLVLECARNLQQPRQHAEHAAVAVPKRPGVIPNHLEHPEYQCRSTEMHGNFIVAAFDQGHDTLQRYRLPYTRFVQSLSLDKPHDQRPRLMMHDFRRHTRSGGRTAGGKLIEAHDTVNGNIVADTHEITLTRVLDDKVLIGYTATHRTRLDVSFPASQPEGSFQRVTHGWLSLTVTRCRIVASWHSTKCRLDHEPSLYGRLSLVQPS